MENIETIASIKAIASDFSSNNDSCEITAIGNGLINDTYLITTPTEQYILQRINRNIFKDMDALQNNLLLITNHIRQCLRESNADDIERRVLTPIKAKNGKYWIEDKLGNAWRATKYINNSITLENITPKLAKVTGQAFAEFHTFLSQTNAPKLRETIPNFHNVEFRINQLHQAVKENINNRLGNCQEEVTELLNRADEMLMAQKLCASGDLPLRIAHCDTKLNNILFDKETNEILCVIDLDTTMPGFVMSDFGDFIRTAANTGLEDDTDLSNVNVDMDIFYNFVQGYIHNASFLTKIERDTLPFGAKMLTYMQSVRFLTDYINGDTYYKTKYAEHNLIRTRAQMKLLHSIDLNYKEMQHYITEI